MTMLMRMLGYPARYVSGYLAGQIDEHTRQESVTGQQGHAWVEVYFPAYGWISFDPTGSVGLPTTLPPGEPLPSASLPSASGGPDSADNGDIRPSHGPVPGTTGSTENNDQGGLLLPVVGIGGVSALLLLLVLWRRPRRPQHPAALYASIVSLASRLGYKPSPTQTVFEYTGMLSEVVPSVSWQLSEVASAQVEVAYGRRQVSSARMVGLVVAQRRIRDALLRLAFHLPGRRPKVARDQTPPRRGQ